MGRVHGSPALRNGPWATFALLLVVACAPRTPQGAAEVTGAGGAESVTVALPPSASEYTTEPVAHEAIVGEQGGALAAAVERAGDERGFAIAPDARLSALAKWIAAQRERTGGVPSAAAMDLASRQLGLVEPLPTISVIVTSDPHALPERVREEASSFFAERSYSHYGGVVERGSTATVSVLVFAQRFVSLAAVPRVLSAGDTLAVSGSLAAGHSAPELAITFPDGHVERGGASGKDRVQLRKQTREPGVYRVEILAEGKLGTTVVANFPVYVGVEPPERVALASPRSRHDERDPRAALLAMINDGRARAGVPELSAHDALAAVALAHSEDMRHSGFVGHTSPTTGSAVDRVTRAGIRSGVVLENIGRGYSLAEVHEGLMASPGHRGNIVHAQATHVGIGVVSEREHDRTAYLVTELFIRESPALRDDDPERLLSAINRVRSDRGAGTLHLDRELSALATRAAKRYFAAPSLGPAGLMNEVQAELRRKPPRAGRVGGAVTVVSALSDLIAVEALLSPRARSVGIGLSQGTRPDTLPNAICAVLLIAE